ncbi:MAG TPA: C40 family peptidase [Segeticoccus sp.]|uniref:C40 family peptidase n=1 Tax=Segeticoccus sp. TaxID=2706531 RepID=UPI002D7E23EC|nr:C40 family peptidase [Segeticoccus sp.]HET8599334.1 C40 family peptidase [Segeticoccus sp.]
MTFLTVCVPVATLWSEPGAARDVDTPATRDQPDVDAWLAALDAHVDGRTGLQGRVLTQLRAGEPAEPTGREEDGWAEVRCPWQPSSLHRDGYPGWLRAAHLDHAHPMAEVPRPAATTTGSLLSVARRHIGLAYLWGGTCPEGLDCSGLVHLAMRDLGLVVPRDAHDQQAFCRPVEPDDAQTGDLYFFAQDGRPAHHVGIVTSAGRMLHAPLTGARIVEEPLSPDRWATLSGAGRLP